MLIIDFEATNVRIADRCIMQTRVARKYKLSNSSLQKFLKGQFCGSSGHGVYGKIEAALIDMDLLVYTVADEEQLAA